MTDDGARGIHLVLSETGTVAVRVSSHSGEPIGGVPVFLQSAHRPLRERGVRDNGPVVFERVALGRHFVLLDRSDQAERHAVDVSHAGERIEIEIKVKMTGTIEGRVLDVSGTPVADVWVTAVPAQLSLTALAANGKRVLTDIEGRFAFARLKPESYSVTGNSAWGETQPTVVETGGTAQLVHRQYGSVSGTVRDRYGNPVTSFCS